MTILVFGRNGQVATELQRLTDVVALGREEANLIDPTACTDAIRAHAPRAVINVAAYTRVDRAEEEEELATTINGTTPKAMAEACAETGTPFVHVSTDYVFEGTGTRPWTPQDTTAPQNAYGRSKLLGEDGVRASGGAYAILRTSWVFSAHGANFVKTMLRLAESQHALSIVGDQIGGPTPARAIAEACLTITDQLAVDTRKSGTYHFSGTPDASWCDFAEEVFAQAGCKVALTAIPTSDYPTPASRPLNSRMDCHSTEQVFGLTRPHWRLALKDVLQELESM